MSINLVLFHGWGFMPEVMEPLSKKLSENYQVTIIDLNKPMDVIRNEIPDHAILMGWSLGGLFALKLASIIPTKKVILIASNPCFLARDNWPGIDPEFFNQFVNELKAEPDAALQKFGYLQVKGMDDERSAFKKLKNYMSKELSRLMLLDILKIDMRGSLKKTNCPVQFILGGKDPLVPIAVHEKIKELMPEAKISIIEEAGHVPVLFDIDAVAHMLVEKQKIQQCFNKAAATYDQAALLQHEVGQSLLAKLPLKIVPEHILDLGAGTGYCTHLLAAHYPSANIIGLDFAYKMLEVAKQMRLSQEHYVCADFDYLPLMDASIDLIYSNFSLQWSLDLSQTLNAAHAVLKQGGYMVFSTLGPKTLYELREASREIDHRPHLNDFLPMLEVQQHLLASGFKILALDSHEQILVFDDVLGLIHNLKEIGANHVFNKDAEGLGNKNYFEKLIDNYQAFKINETFPATYDIIYGVVQK